MIETNHLILKKKKINLYTYNCTSKAENIYLNT